MIIVLGIVVSIIVLCFVYQVFKDENYECKKCRDYKRAWADVWPKKFKDAFGWSILFWAMASVIFCATWWGSYDSYLDTKSFYEATVEQYASAIEIYGDKAVIDIEAAAWTDFKYQGYQENISKFVADLRNRIVAYNEIMIAKMTMDKNPLFSWLVIAPDKSMKLITMKTALKG